MRLDFKYTILKNYSNALALIRSLVPNAVFLWNPGDLRFVFDLSRCEILGTEEIAPLAVCLPYKAENLSSIRSTHIKSQAHM